MKTSRQERRQPRWPLGRSSGRVMSGQSLRWKQKSLFFIHLAWAFGVSLTCIDLCESILPPPPTFFLVESSTFLLIRLKMNKNFYALIRASLIAQLVKNLPAMQETWDRSLGWEDPLEKGKATHSSIQAWRILWTTVHGITKSWTRLSDFHFMLWLDASASPQTVSQLSSMWSHFCRLFSLKDTSS